MSSGLERAAPVLWALCSLLPAAIVLLASILFATRTRGPAAILMVVGAALNIVRALAWIPMSLAQASHALSLSAFVLWSNVLQLFSFFGAMVFAVGLLFAAIQPSESPR
ncbi:MAG TPA: hypothetical protein VKT77_19660 [Chthonomonadaceae bacterium]|nr:hypothetical protein [Chthonomonadaceae bacterium]